MPRALYYTSLFHSHSFISNPPCRAFKRQTEDGLRAADSEKAGETIPPGTFLRHPPDLVLDQFYELVRQHIQSVRNPPDRFKIRFFIAVFNHRQMAPRKPGKSAQNLLRQLFLVSDPADDKTDRGVIEFYHRRQLLCFSVRKKMKNIVCDNRHILSLYAIIDKNVECEGKR